MSSPVIVPPKSFTFQALTTQEIAWSLFDESGAPITGATVTATLYANRDKFKPTIITGTPDTVLNNLALPETPTSSGVYIGQVPVAFNPAPALNGFVLVIIVKDSGNTLLSQFEIPTVVTPAENSIDLISLEDAKNWLGIPSTNTDCDSVIQILITSFSQYVLNKTGRDSFKAILQYTEVYDGNGNSRMFLNNTPITSIISINIGAYAVPQSTSIVVPGWYIEQSKKSIAFRSSAGALYPPQSIYPYCFIPGQGNIQVTYTAGYSFVPYDLVEITMEIVAQNYKRKDWIDLASKSLSISGQGSGTTAYRSWALTPWAAEVLDIYSRYARP